MDLGLTVQRALARGARVDLIAGRFHQRLMTTPGFAQAHASDRQYFFFFFFFFFLRPRMQDSGVHGGGAVRRWPQLGLPRSTVSLGQLAAKAE